MNLATLLVVVAGGSLVWGGAVLHSRQSARSLAVRLQLPYAEQDPSLLNEGLRRLSRIEALLGVSRAGEDQPARSGALLVVVAVALGLAGVIIFATGNVVLGAVLGASIPIATVTGIRFRQRRSRDRLRQTLPHALQILASSLESGAPIDRSLQILARRSPEPLSSELAQVGAEVEMGADLADALEHMVGRIGLEELRWWVFAVRLQRKVGGPLAPVTRALADAMAEREELRQEVQVLTAEGRVSAWVLGALPVVIVVAVHLSSPGYLDPYFEGWGPLWLAGMGLSVGIGIWMVLRMVRGDDA